MTDPSSLTHVTAPEGCSYGTGVRKRHILGHRPDPRVQRWPGRARHALRHNRMPLFWLVAGGTFVLLWGQGTLSAFWDGQTRGDRGVPGDPRGRRRRRAPELRPGAREPERAAVLHRRAGDRPGALGIDRDRAPARAARADGHAGDDRAGPLGPDHRANPSGWGGYQLAAGVRRGRGGVSAVLHGLGVLRGGGKGAAERPGDLGGAGVASTAVGVAEAMRPLESLSEMTLDQYSNAGDTDTFTYWLESQTEQLGSIWGGSAFKFGIFSRKDRSPKTDDARGRYSDKYGWSAKYGDSPQVAFKNVRNIIIDIAQAARRGDLDAVDRADLGVVTKWKIAFLYQNRERPCVLPLYKEASLRMVGGLGKTESPAAMHAALMADRGEHDLIEYGRDLWTKTEDLLAEQWSGQRVLEILNAHEELAAIKAPTSKIAGFRLEDGRELGLDLSPRVPLLYLEPGEWMSKIGGQGYRITEYPPERTRNSNLEANAPRLGLGHPAVQVAVPDDSTLDRLLAAYVSSTTPSLNPTQL
jgi:hypothetical protein